MFEEDIQQHEPFPLLFAMLPPGAPSDTEKLGVEGRRMCLSLEGNEKGDEKYLQAFLIRLPVCQKYLLLSHIQNTSLDP